MATTKYEEGAAPASDVERLRRAIEARGSRPVREAVGLSDTAFYRVLAGAKVRAGTVHQLRAGLDALDGEASR